MTKIKHGNMFAMVAIFCVAVLASTSLTCLSASNTQDNSDMDEASESSSYVFLSACDQGIGEDYEDMRFRLSDVIYEIKSDTSCKVVDYRCDHGSSFVVPDMIIRGERRLVVDEIADNAFSTFIGKNAQSVELGPSIKRIGEGAFKVKVISGLWTGSLQNITFRDIEKSQLTVIGKDAFLRSGISSITIPSSVTDIGSEAFLKCKSLTTVNILAKSYTIGHQAFYGCTSLTSINLENAYRISSEAFKGCSNLTDVNLSSAWDIREYAFDGCNLKHVTFASNIAILEKNAFKGYCFSDTDNHILPHTSSGLGGKQFFKDIDNWYHQR